MDRYYLCIDLKSFYASVECVERGLDPFETNLVVADPSRGNGAICLAITPKLKEQGVKLAYLMDEGGMIVEEPVGGVKGTYGMIGIVEKIIKFHKKIWI